MLRVLAFHLSFRIIIRFDNGIQKVSYNVNKVSGDVSLAAENFRLHRRQVKKPQIFLMQISRNIA